MTGGLDRKAYLRLLTAALVSMFLVRVAFGVLLSVLPAYLREGNTVLGLVSSASPFLEAITIVFAGVVIDRYGHKGVLLTGLGLAAVALYGVALTRNVYVVSLVNAVHGIAAAFILVTTLAIIASYASPAHRGREMGLFNFANVFGYVVGYAAAFVLQDALAARLEYAFIIAGALATAGLLLANRMIVLPKGEKELVRELHHRATLKDFVAAFRTPRLLLLIVPWLIVFSLVAALVTFLPRVTGSVLQLSGGATAAGILVSGIVFVAAQIFWGRLADLYGRELIMLIGATGFAALMSVIVFAYLSTRSNDPGVIFDAVFSHPAILVTLLFVAFAFPPAGLAAIADEAKTGAEGTTMSAYSLTLSLGFIIGPPLVGFISETLGGQGMLLFFALSAAGLFALVLTRYIQVRVTKRGKALEAGP